MSTKKRWVSVCLAAVMLLCCVFVMTMDAQAETVIGSGQCGENLFWSLTDRFKLIISGSGDMYDYDGENLPPWDFYTSKSISIQLPEGLTSIGNRAFRFCDHGAYGITIPAGVTRIGSRAFPAVSGSGFDLTFLSVPPEIADDAFEGASGLTIYAPGWPESVRKDYGAARLYWKVGELALDKNQDLRFDLNEEITADKLRIVARYSNQDTFAYTAKEITIGAYDNSTYGQKTVEINVDGHVIPMTYYVTDGQNHFDMIQVSFNRTPEYPVNSFDIVVTAGDKTLVKDQDYTVSKSGTQNVGEESYLTITGKGNFEGFSHQYAYSVIKRELQNPTTYVRTADFSGMPVSPHFSFREANWGLTAGTDYVSYTENDVNPGKGLLRIVGIGGYAGSVDEDFQIRKRDSSSLHLEGVYVGQADGTLTEDYHTSVNVLTPSSCGFTLNSSSVLTANFILYRVHEDATVEVVKSETKEGGPVVTFVYDFSYVFDEAVDEGGYAYVLEYAWVDTSLGVYAGIAGLAVPSKVKDAQTMQIEALADDGDFRREYFDAYSEDGNLGLINWTVSDSSVAEMDNGVLTYLKPGKVTVTGSYGNLSASKTVTVEEQSLNNALVLCTERTTGDVAVVYGGFLLKEGKDYTKDITEKDGIVDVTITGCGLFEGTIMRQFDTKYGEPVGHTHAFSAVCDPSCESCDFVRESVHTLTPGWKRDAEGHWYVCKLCGEKQDYEAHTFTDPDTCGVCGGLNLPGDMNNDYEVTDADAVYLLRHTLFGDSYPITRNGDFNNDGAVTDADAVYLLRHTLFPDSYPIQ